MLPWRIVAGAFLHFALAAYLLVGLACCAGGFLAGLSSSKLVAQLLPYSVRFTVFYLALTGIATATAAMLDPLLRRRRRRRAERDPAAAELWSRNAMTTAVAEGRSLFDGKTLSMLDTIAGLAWHHDEPAFQTLSADLAEVVRTSTAALATATPVRRQELASITAATLTRIAARLHDLQKERSRLDEGDLHTVARYIDSRYPPPDSAGDSLS